MNVNRRGFFAAIGAILAIGRKWSKRPVLKAGDHLSVKFVGFPIIVDSRIPPNTIEIINVDLWTKATLSSQDGANYYQVTGPSQWKGLDRA